jgi:hypothetical protein
MSSSFDGRFLDHLAEYMIYLSTAPSFWFSLNSSHEHDFHLSKRFGMIPHDYECIMIASNLAERHQKFGFTIKLTNLNAFLTGHRFCTSNDTVSFEVATSKMDYSAFINGTKPTKDRNNIHMIKIGVLDDHSPQKVEMQKMIVTPPQLNGLRIKQQSFRQYMEQYKWNYLLEKEKDDDEDDNNDKDDDDNNEEDGDDNNKKDDSGEKNINDAPVLVTPGGNSIAKSNMARRYPHLSQALGGGEDGFDPMNPSVRKKMCSLLRELNVLLSTEYGLNTTDMSNDKIATYITTQTRTGRGS